MRNFVAHLAYILAVGVVGHYSAQILGGIKAAYSRYKERKAGVASPPPPSAPPQA